MTARELSIHIAQGSYMTEVSHGDCSEQESLYSSQETSGAVPAGHKDQPQKSPAVRQSYSLKGRMHGPSRPGLLRGGKHGVSVCASPL